MGVEISYNKVLRVQRLSALKIEGFSCLGSSRQRENNEAGRNDGACWTILQSVCGRTVKT